MIVSSPFHFQPLKYEALSNTQLRKTFSAAIAGFQTCKMTLRVELRHSHIEIVHEVPMTFFESHHFDISHISKSPWLICVAFLGNRPKTMSCSSLDLKGGISFRKHNRN